MECAIALFTMALMSDGVLSCNSFTSLSALFLSLNIVDVDCVGQDPEQNVADRAIAQLGQNGTGTGHLKFLQEKPSAPRKTK